MKKQIAGFDVAVDHAETVSIIERIGDLADITGNQLEFNVRTGAIHLVDAFAQRATTDKRHHQVCQALLLYHRLVILVDRQDVLVL